MTHPTAGAVTTPAPETKLNQTLEWAKEMEARYPALREIPELDESDVPF